jgi:hypothetical protein
MLRNASGLRPEVMRLFLLVNGGLMALDLAGVACSSGSACQSGSVTPSHVLLALGVPRELASEAEGIEVSDGELLERFPGWTPKQCPSCYGGKPNAWRSVRA